MNDLPERPLLPPLTEEEKEYYRMPNPDRFERDFDEVFDDENQCFNAVTRKEAREITAMSEREQFEEWILKRGYSRCDLSKVQDVYEAPIIQTQWNAWQAGADLAAEREQELVEALQTYRDAVIYLNERCRPDVPGTMLLGFQKLFAAVEQGDKALAKPKAEKDDD